jgi:hypothetical protein
LRFAGGCACPVSGQAAARCRDPQDKPASPLVCSQAQTTALHPLINNRRRARRYGHSSGPILDLNPLERARTELKLPPGLLVRSAPKPRRVVDRVGA